MNVTSHNLYSFVAAPGEKMAEVINRTRQEAKAKIVKVCYKCIVHCTFNNYSPKAH